MNIKRRLIGIVFLIALTMLTACGGGGGSATNDQKTTADFPVNEPFAAALISDGMPDDMARFFAAVKLESNCPSNTTCTYLYTYPNGATREVTLTATPSQYAPTTDELAATALVSNPVYDGKFAASGVEDSTPPTDTQVDISYFVPTTSIPEKSAIIATALPQAAKAAQRSRIRAPGANDGFTINLTEVAAKGADVSIGSLLDHYANTGKAVKSTGSVYAVASALSDIAGAATISKQVNAWLAELDSLEKCAANPTNSLTQSDPGYSAAAVAKIQSTRAEIKQISAVRFINIMGETGSGITPATAILSIPLKSVHSWSEQTLKDASESLMRDARSSVVSCIPTCPTNLVAKGVSESQIDLSWSGSIAANNVTTTWYGISGGNANGQSTSATAWSDTGLNRSTTYCYTVTAYNDYGTAESCPQACGTTFGPPVVKSTGPTNNATGVAVKIAVTATFSEDVDAATVSGSTFTLTGPGGSVSGAVSYSGTTATFTPSADLAYSTTYTATVTTGVIDLDGIAMEANHTWSFTTEAAPVAGNLQFSINIGGAVVASGSANVTWTKFEDLGDVRRYVPSGTITADIAIEGCDAMAGVTVPIHATVPNGPGPTLVVYTASNVAFPNSYQFSLAADPNTMLTFMCGADPNKVAVPMAAPIAIMVGLCTSSELQTFTDEAQLAGTYSCLATGLDSVTWDFSQ